MWSEVLTLADTTQITVIDLAIGEVLSTHEIDPGRSYWASKTKKSPAADNRDP